MKRTPLIKVSNKQRQELALRSKLKRELLAEGPRDLAGNPLCWKCKRRPDFRGLQLIHKIRLSQGGQTTKANCELWCAACHFGSEPGGHNHHEVQTEPQWGYKEQSK